jgi:5-methylcytosine-specific restriction enzyme A
MATFLLTWNPDKWLWNNIQENISQIRENGYYNARWSVGITKHITPDDRIFLMKLGKKGRGIVASGWVVSNVYKEDHWSDDKKQANYVDIHFDSIIDPNSEPIFLIEENLSQMKDRMNWTPQASGVSIPNDVAEELETSWAAFLGQPKAVSKINFANEVDGTKVFIEGSTISVLVNRYERSPEARAICIRKYGAICSVCGFDFSKRFKNIGNGFIHVHHLKPLSKVGKNYKLNPVEDLRPVCPNCHSMLHQKKPEPYTIEQLKAFLF